MTWNGEKFSAFIKKNFFFLPKLTKNLIQPVMIKKSKLLKLRDFKRLKKSTFLCRWKSLMWYYVNNENDWHMYLMKTGFSTFPKIDYYLVTNYYYKNICFWGICTDSLICRFVNLLPSKVSRIKRQIKCDLLTRFFHRLKIRGGKLKCQYFTIFLAKIWCHLNCPNLKIMDLFTNKNV